MRNDDATVGPNRERDVRPYLPVPGDLIEVWRVHLLPGDRRALSPTSRAMIVIANKEDDAFVGFPFGRERPRERVPGLVLSTDPPDEPAPLMRVLVEGHEVGAWMRPAAPGGGWGWLPWRDTSSGFPPVGDGEQDCGQHG